MINDSNDCLNSIVTALTRTSIWRRRLQAQYSADPRNGRASETLTKIAGEGSALSDDQWAALQGHYNWASQSWHDALSQATRSVGFSAHVRAFPDFVEHLAHILNQPRAVA